MSKKPARLALAQLVREDEAPAVPASQDAGIPAGQDAGTPAPRHRGVPVSGAKKLARPPHVAVYFHPDVNRALKEIALARNCKVHDLMLDGVRRVLADHGKDFDALNAKG